MNYKKLIQTKYGVSEYHWQQLRGIAKYLTKLGIGECNGDIEHDEQENCWYTRVKINGIWIRRDRLIAKNTPPILLMKARRIAQKYKCYIYEQADPRGCPLYIYNDEDLKKMPNGVSQSYSTGAVPIAKSSS